MAIAERNGPALVVYLILAVPTEAGRPARKT
jgi:hypothetical protein